MAKSTAIGGVTPATLAYLIVRDSEVSSRFSLVLTPDNATAQKLKKELSFYLPEVFIEQFPDRETLPYDQFSPHQDITSERLKLLRQLRSMS